jgi:Core-2/I-Branching enzyme
MSIAYFVMVHQLPEQFERLMDAIYDPHDLFLVHVDLKSRLGIRRERRGVYRHVRHVCADKPNVHLMRSRFTNWGGWSLSKILLDAISIALRKRNDWTHFVNLSGQCFPLHSMNEIKSEIVAAGDVVHVEMLPIAELPDDDWHHAALPMTETPVRAIIRKGRQPPPTQFKMNYKGSQWVVLPRSFCNWLTKSDMTRTVAAYLRHRLLSDELIMQALVENGPFKHQLAAHYGREIVWPGPQVLTSADQDRLATTCAWFGRKFDPRVDKKIIDWLAERARPYPTHIKR